MYEYIFSFGESYTLKDNNYSLQLFLPDNLEADAEAIFPESRAAPFVAGDATCEKEATPVGATNHANK